MINMLPESYGYFSIATKARWAHEMSFLNGAARHYHALTFVRFSDLMRSQIFQRDTQEKIDNKDTLSFIGEFHDSEVVEDSIDRVLYAEQLSRLPEHYLLIADRMSMAHGLESRVPLVDCDILEYSAALPSQYKIQRGKLKYILREIAAKYYSQEFLYRTKQCFSFPMARWFCGKLREFVETVMRQSELDRTGIFDDAVVQRMLREHFSGRVDHNFRIWMVLNIEVWFRMFILGQQKEAIREWISLSLKPL